MYLVKPKLFGLIKTCVYCGREYIKDVSNNWGCCEDCYYEREVMLCRQCGREISKFEFDDNNGLCYQCDEITEITICRYCGKEYVRNKNESRFDECDSCIGEKNDTFICNNCNKEVTKKEYLVNHGYCSKCYSDECECKECGKEISSYEHILNSGYCTKCRVEGEVEYE